MNKKILAAAIGAAMIVPVAAQADIKVSGAVGADLISLPSHAGISGSGLTFGDWGHSKLQFDGSSDSGLYARAALDTRALFFQWTATNPLYGYYATGNFAAGMAPRDIYFGYKADWGSLQVGRMAGAVKNLEGDPFIATFLELRNNAYMGGGNGSGGFVDNMLQYANKFGDTSIKVQYDPIADTSLPGMASQIDGSNWNGAMALGLKSKIAGANVFLGYNNLGNTAAGGSYYKLGGDMTFSGIKVSLGYQNHDNGAGTTASNFILGGSMDLGNGQLVDVTYSDKGADGTNAFYRVAYMKKMGKGGDVHAGYVTNGSKNSMVGIGSSANAGIFGVGVTVKF